MSLEKEVLQSFENRLKVYSDSTKNSLKKSKSVVNSTGYVAGAAAALAVGTTESEAAVQIYSVKDPLLNAGVSTIPLSGNFVDQDGFDVAGFPDPSGFDFLFNTIIGEGPRSWFRMGTPSDNIIEVAGRPYVSGGGNVYTTFNLAYIFQAGDDVGALPFLPSHKTNDIYLASSGDPAYPPSGDWLGGATGYVGFRIDADGVPGGDTHLGWIEVRVDASNGSGEVIRYGIEEDPNATELTIGISSIPEPSSLGWLAMGASGLLGWRQRRRKVA